MFFTNNSFNRTARTSKRKSVQLGVEALDERLVPTVTYTPAVDGGTLAIKGGGHIQIDLCKAAPTGDPEHGLIVVTENGSKTEWGNLAENVVITLGKGDDLVEITAGDPKNLFVERHFTIKLGDGNNTLRAMLPDATIHTSLTFNISGGSQKDDVSMDLGYTGSGGNTQVYATLGLGNDYFEAKTYGHVDNGHIKIEAYGQGDKDTLVGSSVADYLNGGIGDDTIHGGAGDDTLIGGTGKDYLYGEADNDTLDGGDDKVADHLEGGAGRDRFQMEGYGVRNDPRMVYVNLDDPIDFFASEDSFFGATPPKNKSTRR